MKKDFVVTFSHKGARILKGVNVEDYRNNPNALINPDIPRQIPPRLWVINQGGIGSISEEQYQLRMKAYEEAQKAKLPPLKSSPEPIKAPSWMKGSKKRWPLYASAAAGAGALVYWGIKALMVANGG